MGGIQLKLGFKGGFDLGITLKIPYFAPVQGGQTDVCKQCHLIQAVIDLVVKDPFLGIRMLGKKSGRKLLLGT